MLLRFTTELVSCGLGADALHTAARRRGAIEGMPASDPARSRTW